MFAAKKFFQIRKAAMLHLTASLLGLLFLSCGEHELYSSPKANVWFFNESSYSVSIYQSSFSGTLLKDKLSSGSSFSTTLNPSDNHGLGSVFSIRYWYPVATEGLESGNVWTGGIDPDMQITQNLEGDKSYVIQIPNPSKLELQETFIKIQNVSNKNIEFMQGRNLALRQVGSNEIYIQSGKIGVYNFDSRTEGYEIAGFNIKEGIENFFPFPELTAKSGWIYNFEFNGSTINSIGEQNLIF